MYTSSLTILKLFKIYIDIHLLLSWLETEKHQNYAICEVSFLTRTFVYVMMNVDHTTVHSSINLTSYKGCRFLNCINLN